ncbi:DUF2922 domain-containing protein [Sporolactobacillus spathodeae]|uniref:DUF2922 domain-containing protein n=1 Tax=Sporolactobacillus spathodeae TaxID=1465502 RepID=A0ABS2QBR7_9BACL|nr:DUF2922 domain-containing protein [Sporolactobacillus spathodeae]MBM7658760.1 hypothetical protein [Sporolactobacillus spathodeae]
MKKIDLVFLNEQGKSVTLSLNDPMEPVNAVAVKDAMTEIITRNVFTSAGGQLTSIKSARVSESIITPIELG